MEVIAEYERQFLSILGKALRNYAEKKPCARNDFQSVETKESVILPGHVVEDGIETEK